MLPLVSICIASHNMAHLLGAAIHSCDIQDYPNKEIVVLDDASTDGTETFRYKPTIRYFHSEEPSGTGGAFNKAIRYAKGEIIVLLCADDFFTDTRVISDIVSIFKTYRNVGHITRYYHQFIDGDRRPVRAWRTEDPIEQGNNPSGLAFRKSAMEGCELSNKMFVEASSLVNAVLKKGWAYKILKWDTVAVRIHNSISRSKDYYLKMWTTSPVEEWSKVGGEAIQVDFTSLIQIKNYFKTSAVIKECWNFIKLRPMNLFNIGFWFYALISILTPRFILRKLPHLYRITLGRWTTKEVKRP